MADDWEQYVVKDTKDEWEQYAVETKPPVQKSSGDFLPNKGAVQSAIPAREDSVETLRKEVMTPYDFINHPVKSALKPLVTGVKTIAVPFQRAEAALAGAGLGLQDGNIGNAARQGLQGASGKYNAQLGDLVRTTGFGGNLNEPLAAVAGLGGMIATPGSKGIDAAENVTKTILNSFPKVVNFGGKRSAQKIAEKAAGGIEKVGKALSTKYDELFDSVKGKVKPDEILDAVDEVRSSFPDVANATMNKAFKRLTSIKNSQADLSATELHALKQEIRKTIPKSVWNGYADPDAIQSANLDVYWKITNQLEKMGGAKYKGLSAEYRKYKESERLVRKSFFNQGVPSNAHMGKKIDVPEERAMQYLNKQLGPDEKFLADFEAWSRGQALKKAGAVGIGAAGGLGALGYGASSVLKQ